MHGSILIYRSPLLDIIAPRERDELRNLGLFLYFVLPPLVCHALTAFLVQLPNTFRIRLALLPIYLGVTFYAYTRIITMGGTTRTTHFNQQLMLFLPTITMRNLVWTFKTRPLRRISPSKGSRANVADDNTSKSIWQTIADTCDLLYNFRGIDWDWEQSLRIPADTLNRQSASKAAFVKSSSISIFKISILFGLLQYFETSFCPRTFSRGGSIFDTTLPPLERYLWSSLLTIITGFKIFAMLTLGINLLALFGVLLLRQEPSYWPPLFDKPWLSTSVSELFHRRWHQMCRDCFIHLGFVPFSMAFGKAGGVLGAYLVSGLYHSVGTWAMGGEFIPVTVFFVAVGVASVLEHAFKVVTGRSVQGWMGRTWMFLWIVGWGHLIAESWAQAGFFAK